MIRWLYNLVFPIAFVALLPGYLRRMVRRGNYRRNFWQRFGFYQAEVRARLASGPPRPWLQAVSVGEMLVALKVIAALRECSPGLPLILSTTTTTGYQLAKERVPSGVEVVYTPIDLPGAVRRAFRVLRPSQLIVVDGGLWPNQLWTARRMQVPTALVNARLSPRSERRFRRFRGAAGAMFGLLDLVAVPEETDTQRWHLLGVASERLHRTGSVKFDDATVSGTPAFSVTAGLRDWRRHAGVATDARVLLAGSTHPGEEKIVGSIYTQLRAAFPDLFLIVVPRHVERSASVRAELEGLGLRVMNRTDLLAPHGTTSPDVLLVDTTGELPDWYAEATVVFIGKSLAANGGQNPAEAVAAGKPVVLGPHMENFADLASALLEAGGAFQARDAADLETILQDLLKDPAKAQRAAEVGRRQLDTHRGAAARTAGLLLEQSKNSLASAQDRSHIPGSRYAEEHADQTLSSSG